MGYSKNARHGVPWRLVYVESFATRAEAVNKERLHKTGNGSDELQALLAYRGRRGDVPLSMDPSDPLINDDDYDG